MFDEAKISFRNLRIEDLTLLHKWRNEPFVKEWYGKDESTTFENIEKKYLPRIKGKEPTKCFIVNYEENPVAFIQTYMINGDPHTAGVDLFIGVREYFGKGFGSMMFKKFLKEVVFNQSGINSCIVDPDPENLRAIKSYEKVGFRYLRTVQIPPDPQPRYLMGINKESL